MHFLSSPLIERQASNSDRTDRMMPSNALLISALVLLGYMNRSAHGYAHPADPYDECFSCVNSGKKWSAPNLCRWWFPKDSSYAVDEASCIALIDEGLAKQINTCEDCINSGFTWQVTLEVFSFSAKCSSKSDSCGTKGPESKVICPTSSATCDISNAATCLNCVERGGFWLGNCGYLCPTDAFCPQDANGCEIYEEEERANAIDKCTDCIDAGYTWNVINEVGISVCQSTGCGPVNGFGTWTATCPMTAANCDLDPLGGGVGVWDFGCNYKATDYMPLKVLSCNGSSVTFSLTQVWDVLKLHSVYLEYQGSEGIKCSRYDWIASGSEFVKERTAQCDNGKATILLWIQDGAFVATTAPDFDPHPNCYFNACDCLYEYSIDCNC